MGDCKRCDGKGFYSPDFMTCTVCNGSGYSKRYLDVIEDRHRVRDRIMDAIGRADGDDGTVEVAMYRADYRRLNEELDRLRGGK